MQIGARDSLLLSYAYKVCQFLARFYLANFYSTVIAALIREAFFTPENLG